MPFGAFTSGRHLAFSDTVLNTGAGVQTVEELNGNETKFIPQAIFINSSNDSDEELAGYATVNGWLAGEARTKAKARRIYTRSLQGFAFAGIYSNGTSARGIEVHSGR